MRPVVCSSLKTDNVYCSATGKLLCNGQIALQRANCSATGKLLCNGRSVTTNWVSDELLVLNGAAAFVTLVEQIKRPHEVRLALAPQWDRAMCGLPAAPNGQANHFRAVDYDSLVDSPIVAGDLSIREFHVEGSSVSR